MAFADDRTHIQILDFEELPRPDFVPFLAHRTSLSPGPYSGRAFFMMLEIRSDELGHWEAPLLYLGVENGSFFTNALIAYETQVSHICRIRFGGGLGGGGRDHGRWLEYCLDCLGTELLVADGNQHPKETSSLLRDFPEVEPFLRDCTPDFVEIFRQSPSWTDYGDAIWWVRGEH